jgi:cation:H+ antiporter
MSEILLSSFLLIVGFVLLIASANWLVDGASGLAKRLNIPDLVIGLTIVAFGTSAPELVVNIMAAIKGNSEIALTNILGSNTINTLIILGVTAIIYPITSQKSSYKIEIPLSIFAGIIVLCLGTNFFLESSTGILSRLDGMILLLFFIIFMVHTIYIGKTGNAMQSENFKPMKLWMACILIIIGLVGLIIGGNLIVENAITIAKVWGVSEAIIGVTIVALGTSLPELATSAIAATKKNVDIAIGNIIGSNIFNIFFVLGISTTIQPLKTYSNFIMDTSMVILSSCLIFLFVSGKQHTIKRWHGVILLIIYAVYLYFLLSNI